MTWYRRFHVLTYTVKPGKADEAARWWAEQGQRGYEQLPGVKSVTTYATQWALGGSQALEVWVEMENYAAYDAWDVELGAHPEKYADLYRMTRELFDGGLARSWGAGPSQPSRQPVRWA